MPRWTCQKRSGSSCAASSLSGVRISASPSAREDARVLVVGLEVADVVDRDQPHLRADRRADPGEPSARRARRPPAPAARASRARARARAAGAPAASLAFSACDGVVEALVGHRLQEVVDGVALEGLDRVLVERGDEHDVHAAPRRARHLDARSGPASGCRGTRCRALPRRSAPAPRARSPRCRRSRGRATATCKPLDQALREPRLVVGDDRGRPAPCSAEPPAGSETATRTPRGAFSAIVMRAAPPYSAASRARRFARPRPVEPPIGAVAAPKPTPVSATSSERAPALVARDDRQRAAVDLRLDPVLDRVLDQRLQDRRRQLARARVRRARRSSSAAAVPCASRGRRGRRACSSSLLAERRVARRPRLPPQRAAARSAARACARAVAGSRVDEAHDVRERVVEEVRLDLRLAAPSARQRRLALGGRDARALGLERGLRLRGAARAPT